MKMFIIFIFTPHPSRSAPTLYYWPRSLNPGAIVTRTFRAAILEIRQGSERQRSTTLDNVSYFDAHDFTFFYTLPRAACVHADTPSA